MDPQPANHAPENEASHTEVQYVGFWERFLAFVVDSIWVSIVIGLIVAAAYGGSLPPSSQGLAASIIQLLLGAAAIILYWVFRSTSPGKMIISAIIVDADTLGRPSALQLVGRYCGYYVSILGLGLGFLWIAFDARKQGWHDKLAGTVVVRKPSDWTPRARA
jgi:uncharacterized RDD family membrane protein YckC